MITPVSIERVTVEIPPTVDAPAFARALVMEQGGGLDPAMVADAVLCVSEVVSNAVQHGRPVITLCLDTGRGGLGVEVTDHGDPLDIRLLAAPDDDSPRGRGLRIVESLARAWGVRPGRSASDVDNKTVWFEFYPEAAPTPHAGGPVSATA